MLTTRINGLQIGVHEATGQVEVDGTVYSLDRGEKVTTEEGLGLARDIDGTVTVTGGGTTFPSPATGR